MLTIERSGPGVDAGIPRRVRPYCYSTRDGDMLKRLMARMLIVLAMVVAAQPAAAQPHPGKGLRPMDRSRSLAPRQPVEVERPREPRSPARDAHQRLSPEERRQLRRDIDHHGRELYPGRGR